MCYQRLRCCCSLHRMPQIYLLQPARAKLTPLLCSKRKREVIQFWRSALAAIMELSAIAEKHIDYCRGS